MNRCVFVRRNCRFVRKSRDFFFVWRDVTRLKASTFNRLHARVAIAVPTVTLNSPFLPQWWPKPLPVLTERWPG